MICHTKKYRAFILWSNNDAYEALPEHRKAMEATAIVFSGILFRLTGMADLQAEFDEALWNALVWDQPLSKNPNALPIGNWFGFFMYGGRYRTRLNYGASGVQPPDGNTPPGCCV